MVTASIPLTASFPAHTLRRGRSPLRDRVTVAGAATLSILGSIGALVIIGVAALVVPIAAAIVFLPPLLARF